MRQRLLSFLCVIGLAGALFGAHRLDQALARGRGPRTPAAAVWVARVPPQVLPTRGGATLVISLRDVCAYVAVGDFRREMGVNRLNWWPRRLQRVTACTPSFPKGSPRR